MTTTERQAGMAAAAESELEALAKRVDEAVRRIATLDGAAKEVAEEVKAAVEAVHRAGLSTIVRRMRQDARARELLFELVDDPVVRLLLALHGITWPGVMTEAKRVLDGVRPSLQSQGCDAELVMVDGGVAYVRLRAAGGSAVSVTMPKDVEDALVSRVPAITSVELVANESAPTFISLDVVRAGRPGRRDEGWVRTHPLEEVPEGEITLLELVARDGEETEVIVVRLDGRLTAYLNSCAHQGLPLEAAILDTEAQTLTCPWHGYCFDALSGRCMSAPGAQLEQVPLRVDDGHVWIRVRP